MQMHKTDAGRSHDKRRGIGGALTYAILPLAAAGLIFSGCGEQPDREYGVVASKGLTEYRESGKLGKKPYIDLVKRGKKGVYIKRTELGKGSDEDECRRFMEFEPWPGDSVSVRHTNPTLDGLNIEEFRTTYFPFGEVLSVIGGENNYSEERRRDFYCGNDKDENVVRISVRKRLCSGEPEESDNDKTNTNAKDIANDDSYGVKNKFVIEIPYQTRGELKSIRKRLGRERGVIVHRGRGGTNTVRNRFRSCGREGDTRPRVEKDVDGIVVVHVYNPERDLSWVHGDVYKIDGDIPTARGAGTIGIDSENIHKPD